MTPTCRMPSQRSSLRARFDMLSQPVGGASQLAPALAAPAATAAAATSAASFIPLPTLLSQPRASAGSQAAAWRAKGNSSSGGGGGGSSTAAGSAPPAFASGGAAALSGLRLGSAAASQDLDAYSSEFAWMRSLPATQPAAAPAEDPAEPAQRSGSAAGEAPSLMPCIMPVHGEMQSSELRCCQSRPRRRRGALRAVIGLPACGPHFLCKKA